MEKTSNASLGRDAPAQQLPELPEDVLVNILGRIPVQPRLRSCSPVCSAWAEAAIKAPSALEVYLGGPPQWQRLQGLQGWLVQRGEGVTRLDLAGPREPRMQLQLPCARLTSLQELSMTCMDVGMLQQQAGTGSSSGSSSLLPALHVLHLVSCSLSCDSLRQLSHLSRLTELHLERLACSDLTSTRQLLPQVLCDVLQQAAPRLARLHLTGLHEPFYWRAGSPSIVFGPAALSPLSAMPQLQEATFSSNIFTTDCLQHLPTSLTSLTFDDGVRSWLSSVNRLVLTQAAWPQLQQHTCLQELRLSFMHVQPSILPLLAGSLRRLRLECVSEAAGAGSDYEGEDVLLRALGSLTQLQELVTCNQHFLSSDEQHMSALTASSQLRLLYVHEAWDCDDAQEGPMLPAGAIQHMFPAGRQLPHLRELQIQGDITNYGDHVQLNPSIDHHDVASMVRALPALDSLVLVNVLEGEQAPVQLTALQPGLTSLCVGGSHMGNKGVCLLAKLTTLQDLTVRHTHVTATGLLHLTALRRCTRLEVHDAPNLEAFVCSVTGSDSESAGPQSNGCDDSCEPADSNEFDHDNDSDDSSDESGSDSESLPSDGGNKNTLLLCASAEDQARGVPPVWMQLRDRCERDPMCRQALEAAH